MRLKAPAKLNLYLKVLHKRPDGYHEIETLFERIDLFDTLIFSPAKSGIRVTTDSKEVSGGSGNLITRAAQLLAERYGPTKGVHIHVLKKIPVAAGLGGGSSDAASALLGLNRFWRLGLSQRMLLKHAAVLGSDVPFFILDKPFAIGRGRGEKLRALSLKGVKLWHVLVNPPFSISTKVAYQNLKKAGLTPPNTDVRMLVRSLHDGAFRSSAKLLMNSLELALNNKLKRIVKVKRELAEKGALACLMSGSGSSVFGIFKSRAECVSVARRLGKKHKDWHVFAVATY